MNWFPMLLDDSGYQFHLVGIDFAAAVQKLLDAEVFGIVKEDGLRIYAIASSTPDFLVIGVNGIADLIVIDKAHIFFIDAHAKGGCGNNDINLIVHKSLLNLVALLRLHTRMIKSGVHSTFAQVMANFFGMLAGCGIDDPRFFSTDDSFEYRILFLHFILEEFHTEPEVGAIKALHDYARIVHVQALKYFFANG